ncbi:transcription-repair coupling factor [Ferribacterium limneticum]|uniref:transcription-repair coupling factor n=1 Tax=Ferribacterium limneticum TaxID=76259 RepID=UPI001CFAB2E3|nr:transcription-repair coupling factor [Ferribacterium limneticum]UCV30104.1 transcription-repair coupling factor [Ferribacterium limneticum]UCV34023.1 transcription-repair coupling factor [Ferribacterium limneticum]
MSASSPLLSLSALPKAGARIDLPPLVGSSDALALAEIAVGNAGKLLAVVTANAADAQRLLDEIPWFAPNLRVRLLPDWETLPYDTFSPHQDLVSERLATLWAATQGELDILLVPASTAVYRLAPPAFLAAYTFAFKKGETLDAEKFRSQVTLAGYAHVTQVVSPGEYSIRGGLIDLFPMGSQLPYRLDLFDDEIESIKTFDVDTQRTVYPVPDVRLLPAREFPMDDKGRTHFRQAFRETFEGDPAKSGIYKDISQGIASAGIEYYLPLFFDETATVFDYLPPDAVFVTHGDAPAAISAFWSETRSRYNMLQGDKARPLLPPEQLFLSDEAFFTAAKSYGRLAFLAKDEKPATTALPDIAVDRRAEDPLGKLKNYLASQPGRVLLLAESAGRRETLTTMLTEHGLKPAASADFAGFAAADAPLTLGVGPLHGGFALPGLAFITETELYAGAPRRTRREAARKASFDNWLKDLTELKVGDPVVHESHGIGRYRGLIRMDLGTGEQEFLELHYANEAKLFVPVAQLHVISRYSGAEPDAAPLHTLGSGQWEKAKRKAAEQARDTAAELLTLYAARAARQGHAFEFQENDYEAFADGFGFEETNDQAQAIAAVIEDMRSGKPMDRLVCGDVGFGKTEVALRAAFCAVAGGKQVAVLCPTTLLCEQHYQTFVDRFADWPVKIAEISRFKTAKESAQALQELAEGKIDVIIGTHKLIGKDVKFQRLGLVVIDEEHRFGVRQKETLKAMRAEVDVLTLTATPIPRTLAMSMEGLRDFSVIATAPQKRLAIKTFVSKFSDGIIREAVLRELKRGGQVYFLHNEVDTIENMREKLEKLVPEARIVIGHGQMNERELERVMRDFTGQRANVLLCTTIIETGIDNPHANTILINRSEKFGLAQLHQLRGRVGRSHHQAYAYLLVQDEKAMTKQAKQRLEAIQMSEELGSGFFLAMHDLEIRGAGEVLGDNQSGEMQEVGFNLFTEMLNRAVAHLKQGKAIDTVDLTQPLGISTEINLRTPALLPDAYCPDVHERLTLYKRLANCESAEEIDTLQEELIDRFGELPLQGQSLLATHRLRILVKPLCIQKLDASTDQITLQFGPEFAKNPPIEPIKIIHLIQNNRSYKLAGQDKISLLRHCPTLNDKVAAVKDMIRQLSH